MYLPKDDPIVKEKHATQEKLLNEVRGDLHQYNKRIVEQIKELNKQYKIRFKKAVFSK